MLGFLTKDWLFLIIILLVLIAGFFIAYERGDFVLLLAAFGYKNAPLQTEIPDFTDDQPAENPPAAYIQAGLPQSLPQNSPGGIQEQLDDIAEKIDVIRRQIRDLGVANLAPEKPKSQIPNSKQIQNPNDQNSKPDEQEPQELETNQIQLAVQPAIHQSTQGSGSSATIYPKILISEIQLAPIERRFVELYNPNNFETSLTGWYLQRKTETSDSWNSFVSSTKFEAKSIPANNYFLISRTDAAADILLEDMTLTENNSLVLKNPDREVSDKLGFGQASDFELLATVTPDDGQSIGRKWVNGTEPASQRGEQDTDNNSSDFELQTPTPKAQNIKYETSLFEITTPESTPIVLPETPALETASTENLKPIVINEIQIAPIEQRFIELYNPNDSDIDLTGWYMQRKTKTADSWNSFISSTNFEEKTIPSGGYFIVSRELQNADILLDIALSGDNSLIIKNPQREIIDKIGWGQASDCEGFCAPTPEDGQSIGRINGADTNDNSVDFVISSVPSPKSE